MRRGWPTKLFASLQEQQPTSTPTSSTTASWATSAALSCRVRPRRPERQKAALQSLTPSAPLPEAEYEKFRSAAVAERSTNRLYVTWRNSSGLDCKARTLLRPSCATSRQAQRARGADAAASQSVGPSTQCFCGHRYRQHATDSLSGARGCAPGLPHVPPCSSRPRRTGSPPAPDGLGTIRRGPSRRQARRSTRRMYAAASRAAAAACSTTCPRTVPGRVPFDRTRSRGC